MTRIQQEERPTQNDTSAGDVSDKVTGVVSPGAPLSERRVIGTVTALIDPAKEAYLAYASGRGSLAEYEVAAREREELLRQTGTTYIHRELKIYED